MSQVVVPVSFDFARFQSLSVLIVAKPIRFSFLAKDFSPLHGADAILPSTPQSWQQICLSRVLQSPLGFLFLAAATLCEYLPWLASTRVSYPIHRHIVFAPWHPCLWQQTGFAIPFCSVHPATLQMGEYRQTDCRDRELLCVEPNV